MNNNQQNYPQIDCILHLFESRIKFKRKLIIIVFWLYYLLTLFYILYRLDFDFSKIGSWGFKNLMLIYSPPIIITLYIYLLQNIFSDAFQHVSEKVKLNPLPSDCMLRKAFKKSLIFIYLKAFITILKHFTVLLLPIIIIYSRGTEIPLPIAKNMGLILSMLSSFMITTYLTANLPKLLAKKTSKKQYIYIYWSYFIRSRIASNSISLYFAIPLYLLVNIVIIATGSTFDYNTTLVYENTQYILKNTPQLITLSNVFETGRFGLVVSIFGLWLTAISILTSDLFKQYDEIHECFLRFTLQKLKSKVQNGIKSRYIFMEFNNLSRIAIGHLLLQILEKSKKSKDIREDFDLIIDKKLEIRLIPRAISIIERKLTYLEEVLTDPNSNINYGFISGQGITINQGFQGKVSSKEIALFSIVTQESISSLKLNISTNAKAIINTSEEPSSSLNILNFMSKLNTDPKLVAISTVQDSASHYLLERNHESAIFPIYQEKTEGSYLGSQLFMAWQSLQLNRTKQSNTKQNERTEDNENKKSESNNEGPSVITTGNTSNAPKAEDTSNDNNYPIIIILGNGKSMFYVLKEYITERIHLSENKEDNNCKDRIHCKHGQLEKILTEIENNTLIISNDQTITRNLVNLEFEKQTSKTPNTHQIEPQFKTDQYDTQANQFLGYWNLNITENISPRIKTLKSEPDLVNSITSAINFLDKNGERDFLFVIIDDKYYAEEKILLSTLRSITLTKRIGKTAFLACVNDDQKGEICKMLSPMKTVTENLFNNKGYLANYTELISSKYLVGANQISSILDCIDPEYIGITNEKESELNKQLVKDLHANCKDILVNKELSQKNSTAKNDCDSEIATGEITICGENQPGLLLHILCSLSRINIERIFYDNQKIPSFYFSNSYRVTDVQLEISNTFIFKGNCYLQSINESTNHTDSLFGYTLNGTKKFEDIFSKQVFKSLPVWKKNHECSFDSTCPIALELHPVLELNNNGSQNCNECKTQEKITKDEKDGSPNEKKILAEIKLWGSMDETPGALALALADLLLVGKNTKLLPLENQKSSINIAYESCNICSNGKNVILRLYTTESQSDNITQLYKRETLRNHHNVLGIKVKLNTNIDLDSESDIQEVEDWRKYLTSLKDYFTQFELNKYEFSNSNYEIRILRSDIRNMNGSLDFFEKL